MRQIAAAHVLATHAADAAADGACAMCGKAVEKGNQRDHAASHDSSGWPACRHGCGYRTAKQNNFERHEQLCAKNPAKPAKATVVCPRAGCGETISIRTAGKPACIAEHLAMRHNVGSFWPCPYVGQPMLPDKKGRAAVCDFNPATDKRHVKEHVAKRHGKTMEEAAGLMAGIVPIVRA